MFFNVLGVYLVAVLIAIRVTRGKDISQVTAVWIEIAGCGSLISACIWVLFSDGTFTDDAGTSTLAHLVMGMTFAGLGLLGLKSQSNRPIVM